MLPLIRKAGIEDACLISVLGSVTFYEAYFEQDDPHDLAEYISGSFSLETVRLLLADPQSSFLIACSGEQAIGYAHIKWDSRHDSITTEKTAEIGRIYFIERVWRKGFGTLLLEKCIEEACSRGCGSVWLGVWQQNKRAPAFYVKNGFVKRGTIEFPYGKGVGINDVMEYMIASPANALP